MVFCVWKFILNRSSLPFFLNRASPHLQKIKPLEEAKEAFGVKNIAPFLTHLLASI